MFPLIRPTAKMKQLPTAFRGTSTFCLPLRVQMCMEQSHTHVSKGSMGTSRGTVLPLGGKRVRGERVGMYVRTVS